MSSWWDRISEHARERAGMKEGWAVYQISAEPMDRLEIQVYRLVGNFWRPLTRGPRKGERTWRDAPKESQRTVYITPDEHDAWLKARQERAA